MTRLSWGAVGERFYEAGVDRGVLYVDGADGVAWNGLVSVSESPSGGDATPYFIDGIMYLNHSAPERFEATIEAYTYPEAFELCEGTLPIANGLRITHQPKKSFHLVYRTKIGNDTDGVDHAYKLHFVYNAITSPTQRDNHTISDSISPDNFSWKITAKPPTFTGYKVTSHLILDSREASTGLMTAIEDILYGTDTDAPRMPDVSELIFLTSTFGSSVFDAGTPDEAYFITFDGGTPPGTPATAVIDGGTP